MKTITLTKGKVAIVDEDDYEELSSLKWYCNQHGYAIRNLPRSQRHIGWSEFMHRRIMKLPHGSKMEVDHINGDTLDNRKFNLRVCTHAENQRNRRMQSNNSSGYKGVHFRSDLNKWRALINVEGKSVHLGLFETAEEAHSSYVEATKKFFGEFSPYRVQP